jgi:glycosyltransferase involved in cell wall biosynthesis
MHIIKTKTVIITPYYEDLEASGHFFRELFSIYGNNIYVIAVDDGSTNSPLNHLNFFHHGLDGVILRLRRNVGHQHAIAIGLSWASPFLDDRHYVILMDSDGEDSPSAISTLVSQLSRAKCDLVVASRGNRFESLWFRFCYRLYKLLFVLLTGKLISFGNFMALNHGAVKRLVRMQELSLHIPGTVLRSRLRIESCNIDRGNRYAGESKMNFISLALHGFRGLMIFAEDVLIRVGVACGLISIALVFGITGVIVAKIFGFAIPGWASIILSIFTMILIQTGTLALMTLMLTGMLRSSNLNTKFENNDFIELVITK